MKTGGLMRSSPRIILVGTARAVFLDGCAPGIPMPHIFGPGGSGVLLFIIVVFVGYFIWHKFTVINTRLESLEEEIRKIKSETKGENHD